MLTKIKCFFTIKAYRRMTLLYWKRRIKFIITYPFIWCKAWWQSYKFVEETPDSWDQYVTLKSMENENKELERKYQFGMLVTRGMVAVTMMTIGMFAAFFYEDAEDYSEEKTQTQFDEDKANALAALMEMEKMGGTVPDELRELVENCQLRTYSTEDEISAFGDKARDMIEAIQL